MDKLKEIENLMEPFYWQSQADYDSGDVATAKEASAQFYWLCMKIHEILGTEREGGEVSEGVG